MAPTEPFAPGMLIVAGIAVLGLQYPVAPTTFIQSRGAFTGSRAGGAARAPDRLGAGDAGPETVADARLLHLDDDNIAHGSS